MLLELPVIVEVVTAFAQNEKIESILAVCRERSDRSKSLNVQGDIDLADLTRLYQAAARDMAAAYRGLEGHELYLAS